jgi:hypothetical protein
MQVAREGLGLDDRSAFAHQIVGAIRALGSVGIPCMVWTEDEFLMERLKEVGAE